MMMSRENSGVQRRRVVQSNSFRCPIESNGRSQRRHSMDVDSRRVETPTKMIHRARQRAQNIVHEILLKQDLSRAGVLFSLDANQILDEFAMTVEILKSIIDSKSYSDNLNQQSIVEIVLTKCISALRETKLISNHYDDLLDIIEICLKYSLSNSTNHDINPNSYRSSLIATPRYLELGANQLGSESSSTAHANIVSDILSCILLDYLDEELSVKAIPVCIKILHHHTAKRELIREIVSYLSLVACRSPDLLVDYVYYLASGVLKGYAGLASLLYQIAESHIESMYPLVKHLMRGLKLIDSVADFNYVLQIMYLVSLSHVQLTIVYLDEILAYLPDVNFQDFVLDILYSVARQTPIALDAYLKLFDSKIFYDSFKIEKIISNVGKSIKKQSEYCTDLLVKRIKYIMSRYKRQSAEIPSPKRFSLVIDERLSREDDEQRLIDCEDTDDISLDVSSFDYTSSRRQTGRSMRASASFQYSSERSSAVAVNTQLLNKRFVDLLTGIYEIAQVFPYVLNPHLAELERLFRKHTAKSSSTSNESIAFLIERLKELQRENSPKMSSREEALDELDDLSSTNEEPSSSRLLDKHKEDEINPDHLSNSISNNISNSSNSPDKILTAGIDRFDEEDEPELIALTNNLQIREPELARPDEDDDEEVDEFNEQPPEPLAALSSSRFACELNRQIDESRHPISSTMRIPNEGSQSVRNSMLDRDDVVERFCTKHADKIRNYIRDINRALPMPDLVLSDATPADLLNKSFINSNSLCKKLKPRKPTYTLKFYCAKKSPNCCLFDKNYFEITTVYPALWIHLIFLTIQARSSRVLNQMDDEIIGLKLVYEKLNEKLPFIALVTSSFPQEKQINELQRELKESRLFDLFEWSETNNWQCYLCANPARALNLSEENPSRPLLQGQLKEKHGKWKFFRRWHKRMFTLTGGNIVYFKKDMRKESLNVRYIRSIQPIGSSKSDKNVPKVFEIFTNTNSFLLKAENSQDAGQWLQFLQVTKALQNSRTAAQQEANETIQ